MDKIYYIFAGVNGAGKTTLYNANKDKNIGIRVNVDEILHNNNGDWNNQKDQLNALITAARMIKRCIKDGLTFNHETILTGNAYSFIEKIKNNGFKIYLHYIGLDNCNIAIKRIEERMKKGGHGIDRNDIVRRYNESLDNLKIVIPLCDKIFLYDNSVNFIEIAAGNNGKIDKVFNRCEWFDKLNNI